MLGGVLLANAVYFTLDVFLSTPINFLLNLFHRIVEIIPVGDRISLPIADILAAIISGYVAGIFSFRYRVILGALAPSAGIVAYYTIMTNGGVIQPTVKFVVYNSLPVFGMFGGYISAYFGRNALHSRLGIVIAGFSVFFSTLITGTVISILTSEIARGFALPMLFTTLALSLYLGVLTGKNMRTRQQQDTLNSKAT